MDTAWRLVIDFLINGFDVSSVRLACNVDAGTLVLALPDALSADKLKIWGRLINSAGPDTAERRLNKAIEMNDIIVIRHLMRTVLHIVCDRIHISVRSDPERSINIWWRSLIHGSNERGASYRGANPSGDVGTLVTVWVHSTFKKFIELTPVIYPKINFETDLARNDLEARFELSNGQTPMRSALSVIRTPSSLVTPGGATPALFDTDEENEMCEICGVVYPLQLMTLISACGHLVCLSCLGASVRRRCATPYATPSNLLCPFENCGAFIDRSQVRQMVFPEEYISLEWNEVRMMLQGGAVQCPGCGYMFERIISEGLEDDPLRDKLTCVACHTTFCSMCHTSPYHEGRPCRHGGDDGSAAPKCRYCDMPAQSTDPPVCDAPLCRARGQQACVVPKPCGHHCYGSCGEQTCVSCLEEDCPARHPQQCADDFCVICFTDCLSDAPCLQLECGHVFHKACVEKKIELRWPCARINFKFLQCPLCDKEISHHLLAKVMAPVNKLREALEKRYEDRLRIEGMDECEELTNPQSRYFRKPLEFAADQFNYYQCSKCKRPYFGGLRRCQDVERDEPDKSDLVCGGCCAGSAQCDRHGSYYLEWKCKYCCNTAVWFCWGTTHFCELCHSPPRKTVREECVGEERCPLGAKHPPNGVEFALGCAMCRSKQQTTQSTE